MRRFYERLWDYMRGAPRPDYHVDRLHDAQRKLQRATSKLSDEIDDTFEQLVRSSSTYRKKRSRK